MGILWCAAVHSVPGLNMKVAVTAEGKREAALLLVGERCPERRRQIVADAGAAGETVPLMRFLEIP